MAKSFAATCWQSAGIHLRVYSSSASVVIERAYENSWYTGGFQAAGETVCATARNTDNGVEFINAFVRSANNNITEWCWDGWGRKWTQGTFSATGIDMAAVSWSGAGDPRAIQAFVVGTDGTVSGHIKDGSAWRKTDFTARNATGVEAAGFTTGGEFHTAGALAAGSDVDASGNVRVYVRGTNNKITEYYHGRGWQIGAFSPAGNWKDMSVAAYVKGNSAVSLRAYLIGTDRKLVEQCWDGDGWYAGDLTLSGVDQVSATAWTSGGSPESTHIRVYTKGSDNRVAERYWAGDWQDGDYTAG